MYVVGSENCFDTDYVRYWLGSIHTYSSKTAPVILVASHAEANGADPNEVREENMSAKYLFLKRKNGTLNDLKDILFVLIVFMYTVEGT